MEASVVHNYEPEYGLQSQIANIDKRLSRIERGLELSASLSSIALSS